MFARLLVCLLYTCSCFAKINTEDVNTCVQHMEQYIKTAMQKLKVPGCAVIVLHDNNTIVKCFGQANDRGEKVTPHTIFQLSSLTKTVTALLVCCLIDKRIIDLDDKVRKYVPDFFIGNEYISSIFTIRDLISHRSGFKHFVGDTLWSCGFSTKQIIAALAHINDVSGFRTKYGYQNVIFALVENVIKTATGMSYSEVLAKYLITPLKLEHTTSDPIYTLSSKMARFKYIWNKSGFFDAIKVLFTFKKEQVIDCHSIYNGKASRYNNSDICQRLVATAGVGMSISDFGKIMRMLLNHGKGFVSRHSLDSILHPQVKVETKHDTLMMPRARMVNPHYCIGFFKAQYSDDNKNGKTVYFHTAGVHGASAFFMIAPDENLAICVMCNLGGTAVTLFTEAITYTFMDEIFGFSKIDWIEREYSDRQTQHMDAKKFEDNLIKQYPTAHKKLEDYCGDYENDVYGSLRISKHKDTLYMEILNHKVKLTHANGNVFCFNLCDLATDNYYDQVQYCSFFDNMKKLKVSYLRENNAVFVRK